MKLLLDANISWRLCSFITKNLGECVHVNRIGLLHPIKDSDIWKYAKEHECIIVTQDSDFLQFNELYNNEEYGLLEIV